MKCKNFKRYLLSFLAGVLAVWITMIPAKIAIASYQAPIPQAMFVLGGSSDRMEFAAKFWQYTTQNHCRECCEIVGDRFCGFLLGGLARVLILILQSKSIGHWKLLFSPNPQSLIPSP